MKDRELIERPNAWPRRPYLPMKRVREDASIDDTGVMVEGSGPRVWRVSWLRATTAGVQGEPCEHYGNLDQLIEAGWRTD